MTPEEREAYWDARHAETDRERWRVEASHWRSLRALTVEAAEVMCPEYRRVLAPCGDCLERAAEAIAALDSRGVVFARLRR